MLSERGRLEPNGFKKTSLFPIGAAHSEASLEQRGGIDRGACPAFTRCEKARYLTPYELEAVCYWKSPRAIQYIRSNSPARIRARTRSALATRSERRRLEALRQLKGVSVPMASALLMLLNPKRYGVIDIRVWQLLHKVGTVTKNAGGVGFTFKNWYQFLVLLRYFAKKLGVGARDIERTLFMVHKEYQAGRLYKYSG